MSSRKPKATISSTPPCTETTSLRKTALDVLMTRYCCLWGIGVKVLVSGGAARWRTPMRYGQSMKRGSLASSHGQEYHLRFVHPVLFQYVAYTYSCLHFEKAFVANELVVGAASRQTWLEVRHAVCRWADIAHLAFAV